MEHAFHKAVALADCELSAAEVPGLVQELARNPSLVRALQVYVAMGRRRLARPYEAKRDEPIPQWLIDTVLNAPAGRTVDRRARLASFGAALLEHMRRKYQLSGWAMAGPAFAAVLVGIFAWQHVPRDEPLMTAQLQSALESTVSGRSADGLMPLLTYWSNDQTWCRQFEMRRSGAERTFAVACRMDEGNWRIVIQTPPIPSAGIIPAGSPREHLDRYVASTISGQPLEPAQTAQTIQSGWRPPGAR